MAQITLRFRFIVHLLIAALLLPALVLSSVAPVSADSTTGTSAAFPCLAPGVLNAPPPPAFDPVAATTEQLACYGYPPRPVGDPAKLAFWTDIMNHSRNYALARHVEFDPMPASTIQPYIGTLRNTIYSGYVLNSPGTAVEGIWLQQNTNTLYDNHEVTDWVGISAGGAGNPLYQAGTYACDGGTLFNNCNTPSIGVFYQIPNRTGEYKPGAPQVGPGERVYTYVSYAVQNGQGVAFIYFDNYTRNQTHSYSVTGPTGAGQGIEWVTEDSSAQQLQHHGYPEYHPPYNSVYWQFADYWNGGPYWINLGQVAPNAEYHIMGDGGTAYLAPSYPPSNVGAYSNCSGTYPPNQYPPSC